MIKIGFIGFGDLGNQIRSMLIEDKLEEYDFYYFDDKISNNTNNYSFKEYNKDQFNDLYFIVSLGYKHLKKKHKIINELLKDKRKLFTFIHKSAYVNPTAIIRNGVIIYPMCNIDLNVIIEPGSLLNNSVIISHDSIIGKCNFIAPNTTVNGNVKISNNCFIGSGTIINNNIKIGANCVIGLGTVITQDIPSNTNGIGNPFYKTSKKLKLN